MIIMSIKFNYIFLDVQLCYSIYRYFLLISNDLKKTQLIIIITVFLYCFKRHRISWKKTITTV